METEARTICCEEFILSLFANISDCRFLAKSRLKDLDYYIIMYMFVRYLSLALHRKIFQLGSLTKLVVQQIQTFLVCYLRKFSTE
mgnify:CR=1 FL=1